MGKTFVADLLRKLNAVIDVAKGEITTQIHAIPVISNKIWDPGLTSTAEVILPRAERLDALRTPYSTLNIFIP